MGREAKGDGWFVTASQADVSAVSPKASLLMPRRPNFSDVSPKASLRLPLRADLFLNTHKNARFYKGLASKRPKEGRKMRL